MTKNAELFKLRGSEFYILLTISIIFIMKNIYVAHETQRILNTC